MLRRVARVLRLVFFALGAFLLAWTPVSFVVVVSGSLPVPNGPLLMSEMEVGNGVVGIFSTVPDEFREVELQFRRASDDSLMVPLADFDYLYDGRGAAYVSLPLWLLAAVCLAWPVTSFLVRRRMRGRGFEVETKAAGDPAAVVRRAAKEAGASDASNWAQTQPPPTRALDATR